MDARERLRHLIDAEQGHLAAGIPPDREPALLALVGAIDRLQPDFTTDARPDLVTGGRPSGLGVPLALRRCLDAPEGPGPIAIPDSWAETFLQRCRVVEAAALVLRFGESGAMRLVKTRDDRIDACLTRVPALWSERAGIASWARRLAESVPLGPDPARGLVRRMAYQLPSADESELGGIPVGAHRAVLAALIARVLDEAGAGAGPAVADEPALLTSVAVATGLDTRTAGVAIAAMTLDQTSAAWHAALPGGPQAPLVRLGAGRIALSRRGLLDEPLFFLARELRRRDPEAYHNAASARESAFREDLYALFADRRYARSPGRIVLRTAERRNRTDIDAAIFDRKTGTLALFELKSQDPLARSTEELARQQENLRRAGQQVGAVLDWLNRHGADEVLSRIDAPTAKRFRVQRVLPFVLGRYGADPGDGRDRRAAWGAWPQILAAMDGMAGGNPLLSLHTRLSSGAVAALAPRGGDPVEIKIGGGLVVVHASWAALQASVGGPGTTGP